MSSSPSRLLLPLALLLPLVGCDGDPAAPAAPLEAAPAAFAHSAAHLVVSSFDADRSLTLSNGEVWDFVTSIQYGTARSLIAGDFPGVEFTAGVPEITPAALAGVDIFVVNWLAQSLGAAEICALNTFVAAGGAVLETRAMGGSDRLLGVSTGIFRQTGLLTVVDPTSPLIVGPAGNVGSTIQVGFHDYLPGIADGTSVAHDGVGPVLVSFAETAARAGRAVLVGDEEIFLNGPTSGGAPKMGFASNRVLLRNSFAWLAGAPGAPAGTDYSACGFAPTNTAPVLDPIPGAEIIEGEGYAATGSFSDPDADSWTGTVDYGDGSGVAPLAIAADRTFSLGHVYTAAGAYTVSVTVSDGLASDAGQATVVVLSAAQAIETLADMVDALVADGTLAAGNGTALGSTLAAAAARAHGGNDRAAANTLRAFIRQVEALVRSGRLDGAAGQALVDYAERSIAALG